MNANESGGGRGARPHRPAKPTRKTTSAWPARPPQGTAPVPSAGELQLEADRFCANIRALDALATKYLQTAPDGRTDVLRRAVAADDQAALKPLIAACDLFAAAHPAGHAIWKSVLQQLSHQGGSTIVRSDARAAMVYRIERCKQMHPEYRMARIAALGRRLSHLIERFPDRPFAEAYRQLTVNEQEIFEQAVNRREWSDLFLSPLAQKVLQASRPITPQSRATSIAAARRKRSASYAARQAHTAETPPPKKGRP